MKKLLFALLILSLLTQNVSATEFRSNFVPSEAETYMAEGSSKFWYDLKTVLLDALGRLRPDILEGAKTCLMLICVTLLGSILAIFKTDTKHVTRLVIVVSTGLLVLASGGSLIELGKETVFNISEYGKILLPVLAGSLAAQGAVTTSAAMYAGTALFITLISTLISRLLIPMLYLFLCVCIANCALADKTLESVRAFLKWMLTWSLKSVLYIFTAYITISGVISGTVDSTALKATKLAVSGVVPVVGGILSDASETILLSAGMMKNSVGAYGLIVLLSLLVGPFLKISVHYLLMKGSGMVCAVFSSKEISALIDDYTSVMGYILAMTGVCCVLLMVGVVCMMKGMG